MARDITVRFKGDTADLDADARRAAASMDNFGNKVKGAGDKASGGKWDTLKSKLGGLGQVAKVAAGNMVANLAGTAAQAVTDFAAQSIQAASDLQQSMGAVESVFGPASAAVKKFADDSSTRLGLSKNAYFELAAVSGAQLKSLGFSSGDAAKKTDELTQRGADLAATFGGTTKDAMESIGALIRGETDPIEKYGVSIKASDIAARLAATGQDKLTGAAKKNATAQATLAMLTEQTSSATGAFARENDTLAHKQQVANAKMEDAKAKLGTALLPAMTAITGFMADTLVPGLMAAGEAIGRLVSWLVDKLGPAFTTMLGYVQPVIETIQALWARFGDVILAQVRNVWNTISGVIKAFMQIIKGIFDVFAGIFTGNWSRVWDGIKGIFAGAFNYLKALVTYFVNTLKNTFTGLWRALGDTFGRGVSAVVAWMAGMPGKIWRFISGLPAQLTRLGVDMMRGLVQGLGQGAGALWGWVSGVPGKIWRFLGDFYDKAWHLGADLVRGIGNGISSLLGWLVQKAKDMASAPINAVKSILHIGSPSKVFFGIGQDTMKGFQLGMEAQGPAIASAVASPLGMAGVSIPSSSGGGSGGSAGSVVVNVTVTPLSNPVEVGRQVVEAISAFERMNGTKWRAA